MTDIKIIFEDENLVVVDKPAGLVVNDAESVKGETLQSWLAGRMGWPSPNIKEQATNEFELKQGLVHRLDKDTSGVMVLAKTNAAYEGLKVQFLERKTEKKYQALVHGEFKEEQGIVSLPIERHSKNSSKFAIGSDPSRMAITEWKVIPPPLNSPPNLGGEKGEVLSLLELEPHTGRTHQLRVHLLHLGHPIVSDPIYGWQKKVKNDLKWCPRMFLHACELKFVHPITREPKEFQVELPTDLKQVLLGLVRV